MDWLRSITPLSILLLIGVGLWEIVQPLSRLSQPVARRWAVNFGLYVLLTALSSMVLRMNAVTLAQRHEPWVVFPLFLLALDFCLWLSHFCQHRFRLLWIWHAAHHSDVDLDATTSLRFHPVEGLWDQLILLGLVYALRPSLEATVASMLIVIAAGFFTHANVALPLKADVLISTILMTPGLHRSHHSVQLAHQNSNYGALSTLWDRLFGTLHREDTEATVGLKDVEAEATLSPVHILFQLPWREWRKL
jgi:sterol desaturase/sphingolipid hydroxylase (fatty acid hydroxylase superfamily)